MHLENFSLIQRKRNVPWDNQTIWMWLTARQWAIVEVWWGEYDAGMEAGMEWWMVDKFSITMGIDGIILIGE